MHAQSAPQECPDKHSLTEDIRLAMNTVIRLNNREIQAVIAGDFATLPAIKSELEEVRKRKDSLLDAYYKHVREHGC